MAAVTMTVAAERWLDEVILFGARTNLDGQVADQYSLPAGFGDCAIMTVLYTLSSIATVKVATSRPDAVVLQILSSDVVNTVDVVGTMEMETDQDGAAAVMLSGQCDPDALVLWRQNEKLSVVHGELDINASPTMDSSLFVKVVRVRPQENPASPIQLVR